MKHLIIMYIIVYPSVSECKSLSHTIFYPLVKKQKTIENGPVEIVSFPMNSMVISPRFL